MNKLSFVHIKWTDITVTAVFTDKTESCNVISYCLYRCIVSLFWTVSASVHSMLNTLILYSIVVQILKLYLIFYRLLFCTLPFVVFILRDDVTASTLYNVSDGTCTAILIYIRPFFKKCLFGIALRFIDPEGRERIFITILRLN